MRRACYDQYKRKEAENMKLDKKMAAMTAALPRGEYPRPECVRDEWLCLNGAWSFERDPGASGPGAAF